MRRILYLMMCLHLLLLSACDVHEWPDTPEYVKLHLCLKYETDMTRWDHLYDGTSVVELGYGETYDNHLEHGKIRYVVRTYPVTGKQRTMQDYTQEFVFFKDISEGYDHEVTLDVLSGNYNVMIWSDLVRSSADDHFYNIDSFTEITLQGYHNGNTDHRDVFCGKNILSLPINRGNQTHWTINVEMKRPIAKFEIISNDLMEFVESKGSGFNQYKAKIQYVGYMPNAYSLFAERPVASVTGGVFDSTLTELTDTEVSLGFDYVFVRGNGTTVTIRIGIYDNEDHLISLSDPITIPVKPDHHTILKGKFMTQDTSNGVDIDTGFGGDYNIIL